MDHIRSDIVATRATTTHFNPEEGGSSEAERIHETIMARLRKVNDFAESVINNIEVEKRRRSMRSETPQEKA